MNLRPRRVCLDNNAVGSLFEPRQGRTQEELAVLRATLTYRVHSKSLAVVIPYNVFEEYAPVYRIDRARYLATLEYLERLVGPNIILPTDQLVAAEARVGRRLRYHECVFDAETRRALWEVARSPDMIAEVTPQVRALKERYTVKTMRQRERAQEIYVQRKLGESIARNGRIPELAEVTRAWGKDELPAQIDGWARDALIYMVEDGRLPAEARDLDPAATPTLRSMSAYFMAPIARNLGWQTRIKGSDSYDSHHYAAARYADLLVCDDAEFKETCILIDEQFAKNAIRTFDEFRGDLNTPRCGPVVAFDAHLR